MPSPAPAECVRSEGLAWRPVLCGPATPPSTPAPWLSSACPLCDERKSFLTTDSINSTGRGRLLVWSVAREGGAGVESVGLH